MTKNNFSLYWESNPEWYRFNDEKNCYELTDKATDKAKKSFELYMMPRAEREKLRIGL